MELILFPLNTVEGKLQAFIFTFAWMQFFWELYLAVRQHRLCQRTTKVPKELKDVMNDETFQKARSYFLDKSYFSIIKEIFGIIVTTIILSFGMFNTLWQWTAHIEYLNYNEITLSCGWLWLGQVFSTLVSMPFSVYYTFVLEEKHGFNKQTARFFIIDQIKVIIVTGLLSTPIAALAIVIVQNGGEYFFVWLWLFIGLVMLILMTIYPSLIAPLFDKFTLLPEGELRKSIEELATSVKFPLGQMYVVEGSKRSAHNNAYFTGLFGAKRIVLFDTLFANDGKEGCTDDQILAILAHELGHWKRGHINKYIIINQAILLIIITAFGLMFQFNPLYTSLGFPRGEKPILIGLIAVSQFILAPFNTITGFVSTVLSRRFEFQADAFAKDLGKATTLKEALIKLNKDNLSFPVFDSLYSLWHHSHPVLLERMRKLDELKKTE